MEQTTLGRTELKVSRMGLGCGGHSRLGLALGRSTSEAADVVRAALDLGVNYIDTAESYGTEPVVALALKGVPRESVVLSTKVGSGDDQGPFSPSVYRQRVEACLSRLGTDHIDVMNVHGVLPGEYARVRSDLAPVLVRMREEGKVRFLGVTEQFLKDTAHAMLGQALAEDDLWDVVMVGYSVVNFSAEGQVMDMVRKNGCGTQVMFAVRRALSRPEALMELMDGLVASGQVDPASFDRSDPLGFMGPDLVDAAYRFARHESGMDVVLSGTSSVDHLRANVTSMNAPPLPPEVVARARTIFARVDSVSGN
ncbi:MAG: aldo/keto reductase [Fimbriimonadaceae bacterium]|nr:aldo/keto reductase [Fimbriimonadaceae bacterium]